MDSLQYLKSELALIFKGQFIINDFFAGACVALIAIPMSLAVAMAAGVSPETGLISAIIGGIIAAIFGGSRFSITGPAIAMSVLVAECIANNGISGLLIIGITCGILQLAIGFLRLHYIVKIIPLPVITAFIAAIGFFILLEQLDILTHLSIYSTIPNTLSNISSSLFHNDSFILAVITAIIIFVDIKIFPKSPTIILAVIIPTAMAHFMNLHDVTFVAKLPHNILLANHNFDFINTNIISSIKDGIAVFVLASLETILSISKIDSIADKKYSNINQDFIGQGLANIVTAIFGGIPVTEVITRSALNVNSGAKTRRAGILQALLILLIVYAFPNIVELIPNAVLIGILLSASIAMMNFKKLFDFWHHDKLEAATYIITFVAIISTDLIRGIEIGLIVSLCIVSMRLLATKISIKFGSGKSTVRISLSGNMTFWAFEKLNELQSQILAETELRFVIFEFANLHGIDSTGAKHLIDLANEINIHNMKVIFHGLNSKQQKVLEAQLNTPNEVIPYISTIAESDIKNILEESGLQHSANDILKHGMSQFQEHYAQNNQALIDKLAKEQNPHTLLITCSDSRLDPNAFFSAGLGEIFVVRNVGNVIPKYHPRDNSSEGAAIQFAIDVLNIRNVIICGHTECGAIKASYANIDSNNKTILDNWLQIVKDGFKTNRPQNAREGVEFNLLNQIEHLKTYPNIKLLLKNNLITISAWIYDVHSAQILEWTGKSFVPIVPESSSMI